MLGTADTLREGKTYASEDRGGVYDRAPRARCRSVSPRGAGAGRYQPSSLTQRRPHAGESVRYAARSGVARRHDLCLTDNWGTGRAVIYYPTYDSRPGAATHHDGALGAGQLWHDGPHTRFYERHHHGHGGGWRLLCPKSPGVQSKHPALLRVHSRKRSGAHPYPGEPAAQPEFFKRATVRSHRNRHSAHQVVTKQVVKCEFMPGLASLMVHTLGSGQLAHVQQMIA